MSDLIYDVGLHNGDDARYYLDKGFRVIGIDANPAFCAFCEDRFSEEICLGRMRVVNVGVGPQAGDFDFFVNERESQISTFAPQAGNEDRWTVVRVPMRPLSSVISEHGEPHFVKIDVEHLDHLVLEDMRQAGMRPPYVSAEAHRIETFEALIAMGYAEYKIVRGEQVPLLYGHWEIAQRDGGRRPYEFQPLSSGPFGEDIPGEWLSAGQARAELMRIGLGWVDVHARTRDATQSRKGATRT